MFVFPVLHYFGIEISILKMNVIIAGEREIFVANLSLAQQMHYKKLVMELQ